MPHVFTEIRNDDHSPVEKVNFSGPDAIKNLIRYLDKKYTPLWVKFMR